MLATAKEANVERSPIQNKGSGDRSPRPNEAKLQSGRGSEPDKKVEIKNELISPSDIASARPVKVVPTLEASELNSQEGQDDDKTTASKENSLQQQKAVPHDLQSGVAAQLKSAEFVKQNHINAKLPAPPTDTKGDASVEKVLSKADTPQAPEPIVQKLIPSVTPMKRPAGAPVGVIAGESPREKIVMNQMDSDTSPVLKKVKMEPIIAADKKVEVGKNKAEDDATRTALDRKDNKEGVVRDATPPTAGTKRPWAANRLTQKRPEPFENLESPREGSQAPVLTPSNLPPMTKLSTLPVMSKLPSKFGKKRVKWRDGKEEGQGGEDLR